MSQVIPIIGAFIPVIAIAGTTLFVGLVVTSIGSEIRSRLPRNRFGKHRSEIEHCLDLLKSSGDGSSAVTKWIYADLTNLAMTLDEFRIPYPIVGADDPQYLIVWFNYLAILFPLARLRKLQAARSPLSYSEAVRNHLQSAEVGS